ncbi:MAG: L-threonylcarbamoyladenylate synthase [Bacteroidia bacterium]
MNFDTDIQKCLEVLRSGGTILYPTDTIWGIGCDATNEKAVEKIFSIKQRNETKSLIALVSDDSMLNRFVKDVPEQAWELIEVSDAPLTIIYDAGRGFAKNVLADDGSIGIRMVKDEFCQRLIHKFGKPVVSTSANISGTSPPRNFSEIADEIIASVDYTVNWRQHENSNAKPSSIIKIKTNGEFVIIRK